ncbi:hypothetical protein AbraIFM66950_009661 [Aspergillus brasiliensis]|nr:hypothetical protein AbraIFM66950_009661 [Aspergillus brasiliensis]
MDPRVGVGVFVINHKGQIVLGQRKSSHGAGTWALPGGHLEFNESFESCAAREVLEETGLEVRDIRFLTATNDVMRDEGKHYVTVFMGCSVVGEDAQPEVSELDTQILMIPCSSKKIYVTMIPQLIIPSRYWNPTSVRSGSG